MTPSILGALLIRFAGVLLALSSLPFAAVLVLSGMACAMSDVIDGADGPTVVLTTLQINWPVVIGSVLLPLILGVALILASRPLGRLLARGLTSE
jgi:hypothetical protein